MSLTNSAEKVHTPDRNSRDPGHEPLPTAVSLFALMSWCPWSFWEPPSKQGFQDIPWRLSAELPPQLRDPAQPHRSGHFALNITQKAPCWRGRHTLPQAWGLYIFLWGDFYLLIIDIKLYCLLFFIKHKITQVKCAWCLLWVNECKVHDFPFSWRLREKNPIRKFSACLAISSSIVPPKFPIPCATQHTLSNLTEQSRIDKIMCHWSQIKRRNLDICERAWNLTSDARTPTDAWLILFPWDKRRKLVSESIDTQKRWYRDQKQLI